MTEAGAAVGIPVPGVERPSCRRAAAPRPAVRRISPVHLSACTMGAGVGVAQDHRYTDGGILNPMELAPDRSVRVRFHRTHWPRPGSGCLRALLRKLELRAWVKPLPPVPQWLNDGRPVSSSDAHAQRGWLRQLERGSHRPNRQPRRSDSVHRRQHMDGGSGAPARSHNLSRRDRSRGPPAQP